jgi:hypothetical protein
MSDARASTTNKARSSISDLQHPRSRALDARRSPGVHADARRTARRRQPTTQHAAFGATPRATACDARPCTAGPRWPTRSSVGSGARRSCSTLHAHRDSTFKAAFDSRQPSRSTPDSVLDRALDARPGTRCSINSQQLRCPTAPLPHSHAAQQPRCSSAPLLKRPCN